MGNIQGNVGTIPANMGVVAHARATVTNSAGTLASFISGGIPTAAIPAAGVSGGPLALTPYAVELSVETTDAATSVYYVIDNPYVSNTGIAPSATTGPELPKMPVFAFLPYSDFAGLKLVSTGTSNVQCLFYYGR